MAEGEEKIVTHKKTGKSLRVVEQADGKFKVVGEAPEGEAGYSVPGNLGVTDGPVPKVPAKPAPVPATPAEPAQDPTSPELEEWKRLTEEQKKVAMAAAKEVGPKPPSQLAALGQGMGRGLTFNWGDEISSRLADSMQSVAEMFGAQGLNSGGIPREYAAGSAQEDMRATMDREAGEAIAEHPKTGFVGEVVGGGLATAPLAAFGPLARLGIGAGKAEPASLLGQKFVKAALAGAGAGAAEGAVSGAGANAEDRVAGAERGGLFGAALGGLLTPVAGVASKKIGDVASVARARSTQIPAAEYTDILREGMKKTPDSPRQSLIELGETVEDVGLDKTTLGPATTGTYVDNSSKLAAKAGRKIESLVGELSAPGNTVGVDLTDAARARAEAAQLVENLPNIPDFKPIADKLRKTADALAAEVEIGAPMDYRTAWQTRVLLDDLAKDATGKSEGVYAKQLSQLAGEIQDAMESAVERQRPDLIGSLRQANKEYSAAMKVGRWSSAAEGAAARKPVTGFDAVTMGGPRAAAQAANAGLDSTIASTGRAASRLSAFPGMLTAQQAASLTPEEQAELERALMELSP